MLTNYLTTRLVIDSFFFLAGCMAGHFKNLATGLCEQCPKGNYQPKEGSISCIPCPEGSTTVGDDVKNYTSCRSEYQR